MLLSLTGICLVAGAILAGVNQFTAGPIAVAKATALEEAIKAVAPEFDNKPTEDVYMAVSSDGDSLKIYPAKKGGQVVGGAVESNTKKGFSGEIRVIVGFDMDGKILNYSVLQHAETPGLGAKMQEWFRADKNKQSVLGRTIPDGGLKVTKDGGNVEKINTELLEVLLDNDFIPVIAPTGVGANGETYNINADSVAGEIAGALKAEKLLVLTDVKGIYADYRDEASFISTLSFEKAQELIIRGNIDGGMIPKVKACITALSGGAKKTHIIDGRAEHTILMEIFSDEGVGTEVVKEL